MAEDYNKKKYREKPILLHDLKLNIMAIYRVD